MKFDSGNEIEESLDTDGDLLIRNGEDILYLNIKELNYILNNAPKMIEDYHQKIFEEMEVNPDFCSGCVQLGISNEDSGIEYHCRGSIELCGRM